MKTCVIKSIHPLSSITEEHYCLYDFLGTLNDEFIPSIEYVDTVTAGLNELDYHLHLICLEDNMSPNLLQRIVKNCNSNVLLYQPTMKYLVQDNNLLTCISNLLKDSKVRVLVNNEQLITDLKPEKYIYTHSISERYLNEALNTKNDSFDLAVVELLDTKETLYTKVSLDNIVPYLNANRSRKLDKKKNLIILTNLGISSLRTTPEKLQNSGTLLFGINRFENRPESFFFEKGNLLYPAVQSKAFGRWGYIAEHVGMKVTSDYIHGYKSFKGAALEDVIHLI